MSLTIRQLRYFIAAAETGQVSHAAMELNISQSAVTAGIQGLEAALGARLLARGGQGVSVTPQGARFLSRAKAIIAAVEEATRSPLGEETQVSCDLVAQRKISGCPRTYQHLRSRRKYFDLAQMVLRPLLFLQQ